MEELVPDRHVEDDGESAEKKSQVVRAFVVGNVAIRAHKKPHERTEQKQDQRKTDDAGLRKDLQKIHVRCIARVVAPVSEQGLSPEHAVMSRTDPEDGVLPDDGDEQYEILEPLHERTGGGTFLERDRECRQAKQRNQKERCGGETAEHEAVRHLR